MMGFAHIPFGASCTKTWEKWVSAWLHSSWVSPPPPPKCNTCVFFFSRSHDKDYLEGVCQTDWFCLWKTCMSPPNSAAAHNLKLWRCFIIYGVMTQASLQPSAASWSLLRDCDWGLGWRSRGGQEQSVSSGTGRLVCCISPFLSRPCPDLHSSCAWFIVIAVSVFLEDLLPLESFSS